MAKHKAPRTLSEGRINKGNVNKPPLGPRPTFAGGQGKEADVKQVERLKAGAKLSRELRREWNRWKDLKAAESEVGGSGSGAWMPSKPLGGLGWKDWARGLWAVFRGRATWVAWH